ncbi:hypothetical protein FI667_g16929, partial [Globisporangium splendens]
MAVLVFTTDNKYVCPQEGCSIAYDKLNSLRQHCKRHHGATVTLRAQKTCIEEKRRRQREYTARYREKKNAARRPVKKHYSYTGVDDANEHGVFGCRSPLLAYRQSNIEGAGNGVFALQDFQPGDIVTWYSGEKTASIPDDPSYAIDVRSGFLDGIRSPKQGEGLASFVNREERTKPKCRKNCTIIKCPGEKHSLYLEDLQQVPVTTTYIQIKRLQKLSFSLSHSVAYESSPGDAAIDLTASDGPYVSSTAPTTSCEGVICNGVKCMNMRKNAVIFIMFAKDDSDDFVADGVTRYHLVMRCHTTNPKNKESVIRHKDTWEPGT